MPIHRSNSAKYTSGATHFANLQALSKSALRLDAARPITVMSEPDQALTLAPQQSVLTRGSSCPQVQASAGRIQHI
jgi:hypothetical protein